MYLVSFATTAFFFTFVFITTSQSVLLLNGLNTVISNRLSWAEAKWQQCDENRRDNVQMGRGRGWVRLCVIWFKGRSNQEWQFTVSKRHGGLMHYAWATCVPQVMLVHFALWPTITALTHTTTDREHVAHSAVCKYVCNVCGDTDNYSLVGNQEALKGAVVVMMKWNVMSPIKFSLKWMRWNDKQIHKPIKNNAIHLSVYQTSWIMIWSH